MSIISRCASYVKQNWEGSFVGWIFRLISICNVMSLFHPHLEMASPTASAKRRGGGLGLLPHGVPIRLGGGSPVALPNFSPRREGCLIKNLRGMKFRSDKRVASFQRQAPLLSERQSEGGGRLKSGPKLSLIHI